MADEDPPYAEKNPAPNTKAVQRKISFDAGTDIGWSESAKEKKSETPKVGPAPTWNCVGVNPVARPYIQGGSVASLNAGVQIVHINKVLGPI